MNSLNRIMYISLRNGEHHTLRFLMGSVLLAVWLGSVGFSVIVAAALAGAI